MMEPTRRAPAFQLYPQDFISSLDVQMMSAAEVGAYCLLLFNSWTQARQGYLPNDEAQLRYISRLSAEEWKQSKKKLLAKFTVTPDKKFRFNPRLVSEADKRCQFLERQAENGKRGGRPRKDAAEAPLKADFTETQNNPSLSQPLEVANPTESSSTSTSTSTSIERSTNADSATPSSAAAALKADKEKEKELDFLAFWLAYHGNLSKRGSKSKAKAKWQTLNATTRAHILAGLEAHRADATRNGPDYLPYATTFLSEKRWETETYGTAPITNALPSQPTARQDFPQPGHEQAGQVFYIAGRPGDYNMDKMAAESCLIHFPLAKVVSLAFPQVPYSMQDGNVIRK